MKAPHGSFSLEALRRDPAALETALDLIRRCAGRPVFPTLQDAAVRERARAVAAAQGLEETLRRSFPADLPISVLRRSDFRQYERHGNRQPYDSAFHGLMRRLDAAACALYLGDDSASADPLQDLLWAVCETTWWILPAHPHSVPIDLAVAMTGETLAKIEAVFGDRLEAEVRTRMAHEVRTRILAPFVGSAGAKLGWRTTTSNWNSVCHAGVGIAALVYERQGDALAALFRQLLAGLPAFLDGFTSDGGCTEGPGYWRYGFGWYAKLADALHAFTDGAVDLLGGELPLCIARYPLAVTVAPGMDLTFSDTQPGHLATETASLLDRRLGLPDLFALCATGADGRPRAASLDDLLTYPEKVQAPAEGLFRHDAVLPELGVAKLCGPSGVTLGAKAGHNAEHHNHNDVGSFILFRDGVQLLCDPGAPIYSAATFNAHRYESIFTNSRGHSVPSVDGRMQSAGERFRGSLAVETAPNAKRVTVEFAAAYDVPALQRLTRVLTLAMDAPRVELEDRYGFAGAPLPVEEAFVTKWPAEVAGDGGVVVRADSGAVCRATALSPGRLEVETLTEESREARDGAVLRRIVFRPAWAAGQETVVRLSFEVL